MFDCYVFPQYVVVLARIIHARAEISTAVGHARVECARPSKRGVSAMPHMHSPAAMNGHPFYVLPTATKA